MNAWLIPACRLLAPEEGTALGMACAVLALLLLAVIAIGFGPLRTWIGLGRAHVPPGLSASEESGLLTTWRLYRQLGRNHPTTAGFSAPGVPAFIVPISVGGSALSVRPTPDLTDTLSAHEVPTPGLPG